MSRAVVFLSVVVPIVACGGAQPSRWEPREPAPGPRIACDCDGVERGPKPSEASSDSDPKVVLAVCEGRVTNCRPIRGGGYRRNQLD